MKKMLKSELCKLDEDVQEIVMELLTIMEKNNEDDDFIATKLRGFVSQKVKGANDAIS